MFGARCECGEMFCMEDTAELGLVVAMVVAAAGAGGLLELGGAGWMLGGALCLKTGS